MGNLSQGDVAAVLDLTLKVYSFDGLASFRSELLRELRRLIPADTFCYNELDLPVGHVIGIFDPADATFDGLEERFAATAHQHPGIVLAQAGNHRPHKMSDLLTTRDFHSLDLYHEVYRPLETEDQIYLTLAAPAKATIAINRSRRTFSQRDLQMVELLEPHLCQAYVQAQHREHARALIQAQEAGLREANTGIILLDAAGSVIHASALARRLLAEYYPRLHDSGDLLPETVADWLHAIDPAVPNIHVTAAAQGRLQVRALSGQTPEGWRTVLLDERRSSALTDATSLRRLGLTNRQAQVLRLLAAGNSTQDIADELYLSTATVRKHLEHIYARLGARSRTEAIAIAHQRKH